MGSKRIYKNTENVASWKLLFTLELEGGLSWVAAISSFVAAIQPKLASVIQFHLQGLYTSSVLCIFCCSLLRRDVSTLYDGPPSMVVYVENNTGEELVSPNKLSCPLLASISYKQIQSHYMYACKPKSDTNDNEVRGQSDMWCVDPAAKRDVLGLVLLVSKSQFLGRSTEIESIEWHPADLQRRAGSGGAQVALDFCRLFPLFSFAIHSTLNHLCLTRAKCFLQKAIK